MGEQPREIVAADRRQLFARLRRNERVCPARNAFQRLVQVPSRGHHVRDARAAHEGAVIAVAPQYLLGCAAEQHHCVGRGHCALRAEGEFELAGTVLDLQRAQRQVERLHVLSQQLADRLDKIVADLGQVLVALRKVLDRGRHAGKPGLADITGLHVRVGHLEDMELDFQPGDELVAGVGQLPDRVSKQRAGRKRHRLAGAEIGVAQQPAGFLEPRQHAEGGRIRHDEEIRGALHLGHVEAAATREDGESGLVRGVLGKQRARQGDAFVEGLRRLGDDEGLAAQHAVLVGKRKPHHLQAARLEFAHQPVGRGELRAGPQPVPLDKAHACSLARVFTSSARAQSEARRRFMSASCQ